MYHTWQDYVYSVSRWIINYYIEVNLLKVKNNGYHIHTDYENRVVCDWSATYKAVKVASAQYWNKVIHQNKEWQTVSTREFRRFFPTHFLERLNLRIAISIRLTLLHVRRFFGLTKIEPKKTSLVFYQRLEWLDQGVSGFCCANLLSEMAILKNAASKRTRELFYRSKR